MVEKIEISVFKIFIAIGGILSMIFFWAFVIIKETVFGWTFTIEAEYNFLGQVVAEYSIGLISGEITDQVSNILTPFGICYLIGFFLVLMNIKFDGKQVSKNLELLGIGLIFFGIIGYAMTFLIKINEAYNEIRNLQFSSFIKIEIDYGFGPGFYIAIVVGLLAITELSFENIYHFVLDLSKTKEGGKIIVRPSMSITQPTQAMQPREKSLIFKYCPFCAYKILYRNSNFCSNCGQELKIRN